MSLPFFCCFKPVCYLFCRYATPNFTGWYILINKSTRSNYSSHPNSYTGKDNAICTNPNIIFNKSSSIISALGSPDQHTGIIKYMIIPAHKIYPASHQNIITKRYITRHPRTPAKLYIVSDNNFPFYKKAIWHHPHKPIVLYPRIPHMK